MAEKLCFLFGKKSADTGLQVFLIFKSNIMTLDDKPHSGHP